MNDLARIEHVVVLMLENRSFDHALGSLALEGRPVDGVDAKLARFNTDLDGRKHVVAKLEPPRVSSFVPGPPHEWPYVREQVDRMGGFVRAYQRSAGHADDLQPGDVMNYLTRDQLPMTYFLADHFTICERWFAAVPADTIPNRLYSLAGDAGHVKTTAPRVSWLDIPALDSIFEKMASPDDWLVFTGSIPLIFAVSPWRVFVANSGRWHTLSKFRSTVAEHQLPKLTWIEPTYFWEDKACGAARHVWVDPVFRDTNDDHPPSHIEHGQALIRYVYESLARVPDVWAKTLLIVTYDEHGGFYDHVEPPAIAAGEVGLDGFTHRGVRVPTILISPFAEAQGVARQQFDHCSTLKFLCSWLGIRPWTNRIASPHVASVADALHDEPRGDAPMPAFDNPIAPPPIHSRRRHHHGNVPPLVVDLHKVTYREYPDAYERVFPHARAPLSTRMRWWFRHARRR
ncbi:MAG: alkaline phosphatase family protein [Acidobacteriota bacterium]